MRNRVKWIVRVALLATVPGVVASSCIEPTGPSPRVTEPRVLFVSNRDGNDEIYSMNSRWNERTAAHEQRSARHASDLVA